jgi:hypothetical protein
MTEMKTEQTLLQKEKVQMIQAAVQMGWMLGFEKRKKTKHQRMQKKCWYLT